MLFRALILLLVSAQQAVAGPMIARDGESLYNPKSGKPEARDVIDFAKSLKVDWSNSFANTFAVVMYAVALQPGRVEKLFRENGNGTYEFTFYEPVKHEPHSTPVSFPSGGDGEEAVSKIRDITGGTDLDTVKDRWWVAAAYTVLSAEWDSYYEKVEDSNYLLRPTEKGKVFDNAVNELYSYWPNKEDRPYLQAYIDLVAGQWLLSMLLRRNTIASDYMSTTEPPNTLSSDEIPNVVEHPPAIWADSSMVRLQDPRAYAIDTIGDSEGRRQLKLGRPEAGSQATSTVDLDLNEDGVGGAIIHLEDLEEKWDAENWYEKADIPPMLATKGAER